MRPSCFLLGAALLSSVSVAQSADNGLDGYIGQEKFNFFPLQSRPAFQDATNTCNASLAAYYAAWPSRNATAIKVACSAHRECLLNKFTESLKLYMSSAGLLLGLAPIILSTLGPTPTEVGLLSLQRPLLAFLLGVGAGDMWPGRIVDISGDNPMELLSSSTAIPIGVLIALDRRRSLRIAISACQYILAMVSIFNLIYTSWTLGVQTVGPNNCMTSFQPLTWTLGLVIIQIPVFFIFRVNRWRLEKQGRIPKLRSSWREQFSLCVTKPEFPEQIFRWNARVLVFHYTASILSLTRLIIGIIILSGLLFILIADAATIILRYLVSVLACRLMIMFELSQLKYTHARALASRGSHERMHDEETERVHLRNIPKA